MYICSNAVRMKEHSYLLCKKFQVAGVDYKDPRVSIKAICPYQKMCRDVGYMVNTDDAKKCKWKNQG